MRIAISDLKLEFIFLWLYLAIILFQVLRRKLLLLRRPLDKTQVFPQLAGRNELGLVVVRENITVWHVIIMFVHISHVCLTES